MIHDLKSYPAYKDSGVPWLGEVPEHWEVRRLKTALIHNDSGYWGSDFSSTGPFVLRSNEQTIDGGWRIKAPARRAFTLKEYTESRLAAGDLVITKSSGSEKHIGKTSLVTPDIEAMNCCFSNFMQRIRLKGQVEPRLVWYWLNNTVGRKQLVYGSSTTTGLSNLNGTIIGNLWFSFPSITEQSAIVRYLDHIDKRIRRYIRTKQKLIKLLEEQKKAIIHQAVTHGLDPNVKLKPSGVEWLGDVPEHWEVVRLKQVTTPIEQGWSPQCDAQPATDDEWGVLKVGCVNRDSFDASQNKKLPSSLEPIHSLEIQDGDILVSRANTRELLGLAALAENPCQKLILCDKLFRFRALLERVDSHFLVFAIRSKKSRSQIESRTNGASDSMQNIGQGVIRNLLLSLPPLDEQKLIVKTLDNQTEELSLAINRTQREISLLSEYRTRLIADVVTGKLDVREAAANLPEETEVMETFDDSLAEDGLENGEIEDEQAGELEEEVLV